MTDSLTTPTNTPNTLDNNKPLFAFWSALESIIRPGPSLSTNQLDMTSLEKLMARLACTEPIQGRLKAFSELTGLSDMFNFSEQILNGLLQTTRDLFRVGLGTIENRRTAFETLTVLYLKQTGKFDTFLLKNHLLSLIISNNTSAKCSFLYNEAQIGIK